MKTQKTVHLKIKSHDWHLVDLQGKVLGRAATSIAMLLLGKHKVGYSPHIDNGDYVVVINAKGVELTRKKAANKVYQWHTNHPGGFRERPFAELLDSHPDRVIQRAVTGMLPKNHLRTDRMKRLKVFASAEHPYAEKFRSKKA